MDRIKLLRRLLPSVLNKGEGVSEPPKSSSRSAYKIRTRAVHCNPLRCPIVNHLSIQSQLLGGLTVNHPSLLLLISSIIAQPGITGFCAVVGGVDGSLSEDPRE